MNEYMNERTNERMNEQTNKRTKDRRNEQTNEQTNKQTNKRMSEGFIGQNENLTSEDEDFFGVEFSSGEVGTWKIKDKNLQIYQNLTKIPSNTYLVEA